jgi:hypothetical protein
MVPEALEWITRSMIGLARGWIGAENERVIHSMP